MNRARLRRLALTTLVPAAAITLSLTTGWAQSPPAAAPATPAAPAAPATPPPTSPAATPAPAAPAADSKPAAPAAGTAATPAAPAAAAPAASTPAATPTSPPAAQAPATPPATAQTPPATPDQKVQTADPFGEETTLTPKTVVVIKGKANWDSAFDALIEALKMLTTALDKQGIKQSGPALIVYTSTDDTGFTFQAELPVDQEPKGLPKDITVGKSPDGKVLKFVHRGSYDNMDNTYEAITNHLDEKRLEAKDTFIEEYVTDPLKTAEDKLVINVFVPLK
ncbi:GyrI-like domain-containing protein [Bradyrhizobium sp. U87765 SZCCT0131]|uniref:GyrI-like domain-containing protein n=1 Tax=unclassified Bradyrhizobium TaxID=2631580 RepID=UPI001BA51D72|nr:MULTISPECIES: GyrI-like domain-containing protein [unclassified Bradyrhizobium]MBR1216990.1 GyrI-like domain-containing protein [Bradyrhizobium sp. U87765 SZCCT0131]MBR1259254.1 GyrI-like domain-containing protein [Bradyrhizobium sp. U87765 SZCCT0134]MBR1305395.1 GyrI-like domain-containing protein [Bradyrhizobium sp. U87765 SZCCT0110]MBR1321181.1 GyrI-like domain-containing protein [Bradyrhizobium sp. U87765 SZCCT0109]MBR1350165.1 GyrI-like domain-containing protein [Bradyrhizobium sp. U87